MKRISLKISAIVLFVFLCFSTTMLRAQTCELKISDSIASGPYTVTLSLYYINGGISYLVDSPMTVIYSISGSYSVPLTWGLPIDTRENIYILRVTGIDGNSVPASNNPAYSQWFNTPFYENGGNINIILYFN
ncbi:MAG: hypothetical protein EOM90_10235 [Alphaproteobacteria bacterium]|jgi:hypothetical protein|nr:hypothetical protein [Alphaproteobacteria bacterium]